MVSFSVIPFLIFFFFKLAKKNSDGQFDVWFAM